jgi:hypothetical protein
MNDFYHLFPIASIKFHKSFILADGINVRMNGSVSLTGEEGTMDLGRIPDVHQGINGLSGKALSCRAFAILYTSKP